MTVSRYPLQNNADALDYERASLVVNPKKLDDLFKFAAVIPRVQYLIESAGVKQVTLLLPAKSILYDYPQLSRNGMVRLRLPHSEEELTMMESLENAEIWVGEDTPEGILSFGSEKPQIIVDHPDIVQLQALWKQLPHQKKKFGLITDFPLFRDSFVSIFWKTRTEAIDLILERLRLRYVEKRSLKTIPPAIVVTPNLDFFRLMYQEKEMLMREVLAHSFMQLPDGYPPLVQFARQSIGYKTTEVITGDSLFKRLINIIGRDSLPYTIYLVGGFGNVPAQCRDYFVKVYPNLAENFVGFSTPPFGFLKNPQIMDAIAKDINEKKPDIIFAGMTLPTEEYFVYELMKRGINFGIGFGVGRSIEIITGFQKKEPLIVEKLHLGWIYRALFDAQAARFRKRVINDWVFVFRMLFKRNEG